MKKLRKIIEILTGILLGIIGGRALSEYLRWREERKCASKDCPVCNNICFVCNKKIGKKTHTFKHHNKSLKMIHKSCEEKGKSI